MVSLAQGAEEQDRGGDKNVAGWVPLRTCGEGSSGRIRVLLPMGRMDLFWILLGLFICLWRNILEDQTYTLDRAGNELEAGLGWGKLLKPKSDFATNLCRTKMCLLHPSAGTSPSKLHSHLQLPLAVPRTVMLEGFCWKSLQMGWNSWDAISHWCQVAQ